MLRRKLLPPSTHLSILKVKAPECMDMLDLHQKAGLKIVEDFNLDV